MLALGQPSIAQMAATMTEAEFTSWRLHAAKYALPFRRLELQLAQIAMFIARYIGGASNDSIRDYLFDPPDPVADVEAARKAFDYKPRKKKVTSG